VGAASLAVVLSGALFWGINQQMGIDQEYWDYVGVGAESAGSRVESHGFRAVVVTIRQSGFFGEGLGTASTGARYGGTLMGARVWQESGPSKIMVELGVIGFTAAALLGFTLLRLLWRCLDQMPRAAPEGVLFIGFLGILAANAASFTVSHQAFGDPFLVTLAGFFIGVTLSAPRWAFGYQFARPAVEARH
jgi:hypothetical protein